MKQQTQDNLCVIVFVLLLLGINIGLWMSQPVIDLSATPDTDFWPLHIQTTENLKLKVCIYLHSEHPEGGHLWCENSYLIESGNTSTIAHVLSVIPYGDCFGSYIAEAIINCSGSTLTISPYIGDWYNQCHFPEQYLDFSCPHEFRVFMLW